MELFEHIINHALKAGASDIHVGVGYCPVIRADGEIRFIRDLHILTQDDLESIIQSLIDDRQLEQAHTSREVDFAFSYKDKARFRVNIYHERRGLNIALRYIPDIVPSLDQIGFPKCFKDIVSNPYGLILVTGPTGSGKSTTLASMIDYINESTQQHIITIEDPVEYIHENKQSLIKQREVGEGKDTMSFAQGLRAALREDPDVILVGEMRDLETMSLAITAAETGHLVLSTAHTNNTYQAINRIIDVFAYEQHAQIRAQLAQNLIAIIAQRLLPKVSGGRVAALEVLINTSAVKTQIRDNKIQTIQNTIKTSKAEGMVLLDDYIISLVQNGIVEKKIGDKFIINR